MHNSDKVIDEDYPIPDMATNFHNFFVARILWKIDVSDAYHQTKEEDPKNICIINKSQGLFKMYRLPQGLKNSSATFPNWIKSTLKRIKGRVIFQDIVLVYGTTKEHFDKRFLV